MITVENNKITRIRVDNQTKFFYDEFTRFRVKLYSSGALQMVCTLFGHQDTPAEIEPILRKTIQDLILAKHVHTFYVGHNGNFDNITIKQLRSLKKDYPFINYAVVLAYRPNDTTKNSNNDIVDTVYPEILTQTPPAYAIDKRNFWMLNNADYVITYVKHPVGGALKFKRMAERKGKIVINLADIH